MKKILLVSSIAVFLIATCYYLFLSPNREGSQYSINVVSESKLLKLESQLKPTSEGANVLFDGVSLPYDANSKTFYLPLDMATPEWEAGLFEAKLTEGESASVFFLQNFRLNKKQNYISSGQSIPIIVADHSSIGEYNLVFTGLPMITFEATGDMDENQYGIFEFRLLDTDHTKDWETSCYSAARLRGNTSLTYDKKSLRLYLKDQEKDGGYTKKNQNLLGMRDDDDWILNGIYADSTRIRDVLCTDLWNAVGATSNRYKTSYGTEAKLVEVMISGGYQGTYALMVPIDRKQLNMDSVKQQTEAGNSVVEKIFKKKYSAPLDSSLFLDENMDENALDYRGGFYLKGDYVLGTESEWTSLYEVSSALESDNFNEQMSSKIDVTNVVENWLFFEAIGGFDNRNKNYYYITKNENQKEVGYFIPWDLNISFGAVFAENEYYSEDKIESFTESVSWEPGMSVVENDLDNAKSLAVDTWKDWRSNEFSNQSLIDRIKTLEYQIKDSGAWARESARWPNGNQAEDFRILYDFVEQRMQYMDRYIQSFE